VSFHPLFAPEHAPGRIAVSSSAGGPATDRVKRWLENAGNTLIDVDPAVHDESMATVQGRAHAAILAFALAADEVPDGLETPIYEDLQALAERVTGGNPGVYADIQATFGGAAEIADAASELAASDRDAFAALYEDAGR
jgi:prephenate dehydrogenase